MRTLLQQITYEGFQKVVVLSSPTPYPQKHTRSNSAWAQTKHTTSIVRAIIWYVLRHLNLLSASLNDLSG
jgi:hypothetical protein